MKQDVTNRGSDPFRDAIQRQKELGQRDLEGHQRLMSEMKALPLNPYSNLGRLEMLIDDLSFQIDRSSDAVLRELTEKIGAEMALLQEAMQRFQPAITKQMFVESVVQQQMRRCDELKARQR